MRSCVHLPPAVQELTDQGLLDNTYIIYTSDNGYHLGHHQLGQGKMFPFEEDTRVPLFMTGPGLPQAVVTDYQATMVDLPATLLTLAGKCWMGSRQQRGADGLARATDHLRAGRRQDKQLGHTQPACVLV